MTDLPVTVPGRSPQLRAGTTAFRQTSLALFFGGFGTFALLYAVQPLLPEFVSTFAVSPAKASLVVSLTTAAIAVAIVGAGSLSERFGRKRIMTISLFASAGLMLICAVCRSFGQLLLCRLIMGVALSGVPSVLAAYIVEEIEPGSASYAMGLSISGNAFGGMAGRTASAVLTDWFGWRLALFGLGAVVFAIAILFWRTLPESRQFVRREFGPWRMIRDVGTSLGDPGTRWACVLALLLMGSFVTLYNYVGFRLTKPPFSLDQAELGGLFTVYLAGILATPVTGRLADRIGLIPTLCLCILLILLGAELTRPDWLPAIVAGVAIVTVGFFGGHACALSWVTKRAASFRATASSLYLLFYYLGASVAGTFGGVVFADHGWNGLVTLLTVMQVAALVIAGGLTRLPAP